MTRQVPTANELFFSGRSFDPSELEELERLFFSNLVLKNGTFKTTSHRRLDDLNALALKHLPPDRPLEIMDVAVSSGISTAEWAQALSSADVNYHMTAGDLTVNAYLICISKNVRALVDRSGHLLQLDVKGKGIRTPLSKRNLLRHFFPFVYARSVLALLGNTLRDAAEHYYQEPPTRLGFAYRPLQLVSTSLCKFTQIEVVEDDILRSAVYPGRFHVLRAANILNRVYFDNTTLSTMLINLRSRLRTGGLLIVCRTLENNVNHGTIFKLLDDGRFAPVAQLNNGSEIEDLITKLE